MKIAAEEHIEALDGSELNGLLAGHWTPALVKLYETLPPQRRIIRLVFEVLDG